MQSQILVLQRIVDELFKVMGQPPIVATLITAEGDSLLIGHEEVTITCKKIMRPSIRGDVPVDGFLVEKLVVRNANPDLNGGFDWDSNMSEVLETTSLFDAAKSAVVAYFSQTIEIVAVKVQDALYAEEFKKENSHGT